MPKIPSVRIVDLATAMASNLKQEIIGIRPGEKLHETMCPEDDSHLTLEFHDHYVIKPSIRFVDIEMDYTVNGVGEQGQEIERGFEYNSGTNEDFLGIEQIREFNRIAEQ